jgi:hypothetical protein
MLRGIFMKYIGNNHIGFDANALGFPSVKGCQVVVYQTTNGLYGFHDMKGGGGLDIDTAKANAFAFWVQNHHQTHFQESIRLFGVINQTHQYYNTTAGNTQWRNMLIGIANALRFSGPIHGVRITDHVGANDSLYIRFDVNQNNCQIRYKRWSKMGFDMANTLPLDSNSQQALGRIGLGNVLGAVYEAKDPFDDIREVLRTGRTDEGNLNIVSANSIKNFR